jgi:hypothetical protein
MTVSHPQICELMRIWKDVLGIDEITANDDFFTVGGTSLSAIRIEAALFEKGWFLSAADILQNPKLCDMAALMALAEEIDWEAEA